MAKPTSAHGTHASPDNRLVFDRPDAVILSHQRSGTHFLLATLASHPKIAGRGECVLGYRRYLSTGRINPAMSNNFKNQPHKLNIAIVMYSQVSLFEQLCGSLFNFKIIHLLRNPHATALSLAQWHADRDYGRGEYLPHYRVGQMMPQPRPISMQKVALLEKQIVEVQKRYLRKTNIYCDVLQVAYEDLTQNQQTNRLDQYWARVLLEFLGCDDAPLTNSLQKTGTRGNVISAQANILKKQ